MYNIFLLVESMQLPRELAHVYLDSTVCYFPAVCFGTVHIPCIHACMYTHVDYEPTVQ